MFQRLYDRYKRIIELVIYPIILLILPIIKYDQGVDISDSTYSLGNYMFADRLEGMWVISTFLSNKIGSIILKLPGAHQLRFANIYTGLVLSAIALIVYFVLKDDLDARNVFIAEFAAVCFCWIPTGILYNYLSYLFMVAGALLLYKGIVKENKKLFFLAGLILGANVFVRIPNITQMALIVVLWVWGIIYKKRIVKKTLVCIAGYALGLVICIAMIIATFGLGGLSDMISGLAGITSTDESYTPLAMITGTLKDYIRSSKWFVVILAVLAIGVLIFTLIDRTILSRHIDDDKPTYNTIMLVSSGCFYMAVIVVMLRFFWGRGMFSFRYYEDYTSMYEWGMVALIASLIADIYVIIHSVKNRDYNTDERTLLLAMISLVIIMIAPLGSNNHTYQNLNNLFLVLPVTVTICFNCISRFNAMRRNKDKTGTTFGLPFSIMAYSLIVVVLIQSYGFHLEFVFRDGTRGEKRDYQVEGIYSLKGMYTNKENAEEILKIYSLIEEEAPDELILYGNCPGLVYVTGIPCAMSSSWPDLDSNPLSRIQDDLDRIVGKIDENYTIVAVVRKNEQLSEAYNKKLETIEKFLYDQKFELVMNDEEFSIYER
ncbi:MAG: hypothetical protein IKQ44_05350 [Lachnospiraceae bacterium]|nr:hypothetical protein [Lachnospiraceae bacterium]